MKLPTIFLNGGRRLQKKGKESYITWGKSDGVRRALGIRGLNSPHLGLCCSAAGKTGKRLERKQKLSKEGSPM